MGNSRTAGRQGRPPRRPGRPETRARRTWIAVALLLGLAVPAPAAEEWSVRAVPVKPGTAVPRCVLESTRQPLPDGYQTTWAQIVVDDKAVRVTSRSVLDPSEGDIGLAVDDGEFVPADEVRGKKTAVFTTRHAALVEEFKRGLKVRVQLRFWPTWPRTGTHSATFSLIGFTRAHGQMARCGAS